MKRNPITAAQPQHQQAYTHLPPQPYHPQRYGQVSSSAAPHPAHSMPSQRPTLLDISFADCPKTKKESLQLFTAGCEGIPEVEALLHEEIGEQGTAEFRVFSDLRQFGIDTADFPPLNSQTNADSYSHMYLGVGMEHINSLSSLRSMPGFNSLKLDTLLNTYRQHSFNSLQAPPLVNQIAHTVIPQAVRVPPQQNLGFVVPSTPGWPFQK
jgi:hypothetical protein